MKNCWFLFALVIKGYCSYSQDSLKTSTASPLSITGYVEIYYSYDFNKPATNEKTSFLYSHNRHNEFNLNLGFIKTSYATGMIRANLTLAAGTYITANYSSEPAGLKNIYEANVGLKLSRTKNLWLDAGIMSSHIGFESAEAKECWNLTRSMLAEGSPYYESGARLSYNNNSAKWLLSALVLNGWQRITRLPGNSLPAFGVQIQFKPFANTTLNYSNFIGSTKPDSNRLIRYYHNLYAIFALGKLGLTTGFDIGMEQQSKGSKKLNTWFSPIVMFRYPLSDKWNIAARAEYYQDKNGVVNFTGTPHGFQTSGYSINIDFSPITNATVRLEASTLQSRDAIFEKPPGLSNQCSFVTASIAVRF